MTVTFDQLLQSGTSAIANWYLKAGLADFIPVSPLTVNGYTVSGLMVYTGGVGGSVVDYFAVPADVVGQNAVPVAAFSNFPVTIL